LRSYSISVIVTQDGYAMKYFSSFILIFPILLGTINFIEDNYLVFQRDQILITLNKMRLNYLESDCHELITILKQDPNWKNKLYDPVITSQNELDQQILLYDELYNCLSVNEGENTVEEQQILHLTELFLIFIKGLNTPIGNSRLELVELNETNDPAIVRIRDQLGIPPPPGYVFIRSYSDISSIPMPIREIFEQHHAAGVTLFTRYIAILEEGSNTWQEKSLQARSLPKTYSHELVHAYVNSSVGTTTIGNLPTWFHEGIAIYFSRSGENQAIVTPNFTLYLTPPPDYRQYDLNFKFLESKLGKKNLINRIGESITHKNPEILFTGLDIHDGYELQLQALEWKQEKDLYQTLIGTAVLFILAYLIVSGQVNQIPILKIVSICESCNKWYWFWNKSKIQLYSPPIRIWLDSELGVEYPYSTYNHRVCETCVTKSQTLWKAYNKRIQELISTDRESANQTYQAWLQGAPTYSNQITKTSIKINYQEAIKKFVNIALLTKYSPLMVGESPNFEFATDIINQAEDLINSPPPRYDNLLQSSSDDLLNPYPILWSVFCDDEANIVIEWSQLEQTMQLENI